MKHSVQVYLDKHVPGLNKMVTLAIAIAMLNEEDFKKYVNDVEFRVRGNIKRTAKVPKQLLEKFLEHFSFFPGSGDFAGKIGMKTLLTSLAVQYCFDKYSNFPYVVSLLSSESTNYTTTEDSMDSKKIQEDNVKVTGTMGESDSTELVGNNTHDMSGILESCSDEENDCDEEKECNIDEDLIMKWWWGVVVPYHQKINRSNKYRHRPRF